MVELAIVLIIFQIIFIGILEYARYYYLVQVSNNAVIYELVHAGDGATSTQFSNAVATKMNGTENMLFGYTISVQNVNTSTGAAIANSNWNDAHLVVQSWLRFHALMPHQRHSFCFCPHRLHSSLQHHE